MADAEEDNNDISNEEDGDIIKVPPSLFSLECAMEVMVDFIEMFPTACFVPPTYGHPCNKALS